METVSRMIANLVRAELLTNGGVMKVRQRARSAVYCERSAANSVFFLESGLVKLCKRKGGTQVILEIFTPGELFGVSTLAELTRPTDAQTVIESIVYSIPRSVFISFCDEHPIMWRLLSQLVLERSLNLQKRIELLLTKDVENRIVACLNEVATAFGERSEAGEHRVP